jgi:hypothetical protein
MSQPLPERRVSPRRPFQARLVFEVDKQKFRGNCQDLSEGGLCFIAGLEVPVNTQLTIYLFLSGAAATAKLEVCGVVRWRVRLEDVGLFRYGVSFLGLHDNDRKLLAAFTAKPD